MQLIGANRAAPFFHLVPVFGTIMSIVFLGEHPQLFHFIGFALVLTGVFVASRRPQPPAGCDRTRAVTYGGKSAISCACRSQDPAMKLRASNLMIGTLTLAFIAGSFGALLGYQKYRRHQAVGCRSGWCSKAPPRACARAAASISHGIRVGEVRSLKLDNPRRVVALAMIDNTTPLRKDTLVGLEFQGLTGIAAISFTGGTVDGPPPPLDDDGIPVLTADPDEPLDTQEKIRVALRNVDQVIEDNEEGIKDTLRNFETFTASLPAMASASPASSASAEIGITAIDNGFGKTQAVS